MARVNVTVELDLPEGIEIREYERHGERHAFHVGWPLPQRCRCDRCGQEGPTRLDYKDTFYTVRDLDLWGQPTFWIYQPPLATTAPRADAASTCCPLSNARTSPPTTCGPPSGWRC